ncbi:MAG: GGDEF domain-containing protein [Gammaproteobacteria bacterium]|nr:GGDEF domain-containing protein [Gammaproteobacteria bacterium]
MSRVVAALSPRTSSLVQQEADFTAEGAPARGSAGTAAPERPPGPVADVETLKATLAAETRRREQLELEVSIARAALGRARAGLAGARAGEQQARHLALHDGLTLLPNRRYFQQRLGQALSEAAPRHPALALLYIDLDDFKPINDRYGHDTGDELLRIVAERLARAVRAEDMMSRLGGDEFGCLPAAFRDLEQLEQLAAKLYDTVSAPMKIGTLILTIRPSIGIATCPADGRTADALLKSADAAMYRAKRQRTKYSFCERRVGAQPAGQPAAAEIRLIPTPGRASGPAG